MLLSRLLTNLSCKRRSVRDMQEDLNLQELTYSVLKMDLDNLLYYTVQ